jgi:hypothetical protein
MLLENAPKVLDSELFVSDEELAESIKQFELFQSVAIVGNHSDFVGAGDGNRTRVLSLGS